jgi:hypothetical protein
MILNGNFVREEDIKSVVKEPVYDSWYGSFAGEFHKGDLNPNWVMATIFTTNGKIEIKMPTKEYDNLIRHLDDK